MVARLIALARGMYAVGLITAAERDELIALAGNLGSEL